MEAEGLRSLAHIRDLAVTGFWEVAKRYRFFRDLMKRCERAIEKSRHVLFIPVDYPGFNMRLAAKVRSHKLRVAWYIAPQLWAWGEKRAKDLASVVDRLLVVFPFEVEFFSKHGIRAEYVGHPLSESIDLDHAPERSASEILLLPGSRRQEVHHHVPLLAGTIDRLNRSRPDLSFIVAQARNVDPHTLQPLIDRGATVSIDAERSMATATAGLIKAGTSTLEAAMRGLPFATYYRTSMLTYEVSKRLVNVTSVTMMNLLLNRPVIHEYIQRDATAQNLEMEVIDLVSNAHRRVELTHAMDEVRSLLSGGGASANAATIIAEMVDR